MGRLAATLATVFSAHSRLPVVVLIILASTLLMTCNTVGWASYNPNAHGYPAIFLNPNPPYPGSLVQVTGTGFEKGPSSCSISSYPSTLFQASATCFGGAFGNITGIFQVNKLAENAIYVVTVADYVTVSNETIPYILQYANATFQVIPQPVETVTTITTISAGATTRLVTTTETITSTSITEIRSGISVLQGAIAVSAGASVTAVAAAVYLLGKSADLRALKEALVRSEDTISNLKPRQAGKRPDFGVFSVEVRSGIERMET